MCLKNAILIMSNGKQNNLYSDKRKRNLFSFILPYDMLFVNVLYMLYAYWQ